MLENIYNQLIDKIKWTGKESRSTKSSLQNEHLKLHRFLPLFKGILGVLVFCVKGLSVVLPVK